MIVLLRYIEVFFSLVRTSRSTTSDSAGSVVGVKINYTRAMCWGKFLQASVSNTFFSNEVSGGGKHAQNYDDTILSLTAGGSPAQIPSKLLQFSSSGEITAQIPDEHVRKTGVGGNNAQISEQDSPKFLQATVSNTVFPNEVSGVGKHAQIYDDTILLPTAGESAAQIVSKLFQFSSYGVISAQISDEHVRKPGVGGNNAQISVQNSTLLKAGQIHAQNSKELVQVIGDAQISDKHDQLSGVVGNNTKISGQNRQLLKAGQIHAQNCEEHDQVTGAGGSHAQISVPNRLIVKAGGISAQIFLLNMSNCQVQVELIQESLNKIDYY